MDLLTQAGVGERLRREGLASDGIYIAFAGSRHHINFSALTGGRAITIYGQNKVVKDLIEARRATGAPLLFEDPGRQRPRSGDLPAAYHVQRTWPAARVDVRFHCGLRRLPRHLPCVHPMQPRSGRSSASIRSVGWASLPAAPPASDELVYSRHDRGFALFSMRSPTITRLYLQCAPDEDVDQWPDDRIWKELQTRLQTDDGWRPNEGAILQKGVTGMRSFVVEADALRAALPGR